MSYGVQKSFADTETKIHFLYCTLAISIQDFPVKLCITHFTAVTLMFYVLHSWHCLSSWQSRVCCLCTSVSRLGWFRHPTLGCPENMPFSYFSVETLMFWIYDFYTAHQDPSSRTSVWVCPCSVLRLWCPEYMISILHTKTLRPELQYGCVLVQCWDLDVLNIWFLYCTPRPFVQNFSMGVSLFSVETLMSWIYGFYTAHQDPSSRTSVWVCPCSVLRLWCPEYMISILHTKTLRPELQYGCVLVQCWDLDVLNIWFLYCTPRPFVQNFSMGVSLFSVETLMSWIYGFYTAHQDPSSRTSVWVCPCSVLRLWCPEYMVSVLHTEPLHPEFQYGCVLSVGPHHLEQLLGILLSPAAACLGELEQNFNFAEMKISQMMRSLCKVLHILHS